MNKAELVRAVYESKTAKLSMIEIDAVISEMLLHNGEPIPCACVTSSKGLLGVNIKIKELMHCYPLSKASVYRALCEQ